MYKIHIKKRFKKGDKTKMKKEKKSEWKGTLKAMVIVAVLCMGIGIAVAAWDDTKNTGDALTAVEWNAMTADQESRLKTDGTMAMVGKLDMNGNYIDNVSYMESSGYDYELNMLMNHGVRVRPSLLGFTDDLYLIVEQNNLANNPRGYFGVSSTNDGFMEIGYTKNDVSQAWLQFVNKTIIPWEDNTHDFGSSDKQFANIYTSNTRSGNYYSGDGTQGISTTINTKNHAGTNCTITVKDGLITGTTC